MLVLFILLLLVGIVYIFQFNLEGFKEKVEIDAEKKMEKNQQAIKQTKQEILDVEKKMDKIHQKAKKQAEQEVLDINLIDYPEKIYYKHLYFLGIPFYTVKKKVIFE